MTKGALYDKTRKRLERYTAFNQKTIDFAARLAQKQAEYATYQAFLKAADVPLQPTLFVTRSGRGVPLVDISPRTGKEAGAFVVHLPMGNSLDPNQLYQVATLALAFPEYRLIAFGNPSGKPYAYREQGFSLRDWWRVAFTKNKRAAVSAELEYLASQNVAQVYHTGYSYGALKALLTAYYAPPEQTKGLLLLDPAAHSRGLRQLFGDFNATFAPLGQYVNRTELQTFFDARRDAANQVRYKRGIARPVNIAIGIMLARTDFIPLLKKVLTKHSHISAYVAWGSKSELGNDAHMKASLHSFTHETAKGRVRSLRLDGDTHAFANDIHLYVAIVHDSLR